MINKTPKIPFGTSIYYLKELKVLIINKLICTDDTETNLQYWIVMNKAAQNKEIHVETKEHNTKTSEKIVRDNGKGQN